MAVKENNINTLINYLKINKAITLKKIEELLNIKTRNAKNYIKYLREYGVNLKFKEGKYCILEHNYHMPALSIDALRKIVIINKISHSLKPVNKREIINGIVTKYSNKTLERDIAECEKEGYIIKNNNTYRLGKNTNALFLVSFNDIIKFIDKADIYYNSMAFTEDIQKLKAKIEIQSNYYGYSYEIFSLGRKYKKNFFSDFLNKMDKYNYKGKKLIYEYNSNVGIIKKKVDTCMFYYSRDKDKTYIVGKEENNLILISIDSIISISETLEINNSFLNKDVINKVNLMFSASFTGPYVVKVQFDNKFNIKDKILALSRSRENSIVEINDRNLVYKDCIYGLYDFANYLRSYGSSCEVIAPEELRNIMINTYKRTLDRYEEEFNN